MHRLIKPILLIAVILAIPVVPFVAFGPSMESQIEEQVRSTLSPGTVGAMVVGLLAVDIFLPVPSSVVSTVAGNVLGFWLGTAASWLGMTLGAVLGFVLARKLGRPLATRFSREEDLGRIDALSVRYGPLVVVLARPVPILAEASILFLGATQLGWSRFLIAIGLSNLGLAMAYAAIGGLTSFPISLGASLALPLLFTALARWLWPNKT